MQERALKPIAPPDTRVRLPGSKSLTNRALVCAALAEGTSRLLHWLDSEDTRAMLAGLSRLGVEVSEEQGQLHIRGVGGRFAIPLHPVDCQASGTTMRFLTACSTLVPGRVVLDGTPRMRERPIQDLADALSAMGASVRTVAGCPPVTVQGGSLRGGRVALDASRSSQFLSALLMVAPFARETVEIQACQITSRPYVDMTLETMASFGVAVDTNGADLFQIASGQRYRARSCTIEPDASSATYFFAAAAVTGGRIRIEDLTPASSQPDVRFVEVLERMGCTVERESGWISVRGGRYLHGIEIDMNPMPDAALTLAVVACFAKGPTEIRGIGNLRLKETNRLEALSRELSKLGAEVRATENALEIRPPSEPHPARIETYDDHRMAMSFAVAGLRVPGIVIENPDCVAKTFPDFWERLERLG
ncbi:MAG: 3-phosphoshikimate 1-carboxyvinyltransferase [Myxococcota bacterium]